jgi:dihydroorotase
MSLLLRGGRVLSPSTGTSGIDAHLDVLLDGDRVARMARGIAPPSSARVVDCRDRLVVPGLIDMHTHLREPGDEHKEDIASGCRAAAAGGFTAVCPMPNTRPPNDCRAVTQLISQRARAAAVRVYPIGAISRGLCGETLAEIAEMREAGIVAVSDDGRPVQSSGLMRSALEYAKTFDLPVIQHCEDLGLSQGAPMNEGLAATRAGLSGQPAAAEEAMLARDLALVALVGARYHMAHLSTAGAVRLLRDAKRRGLPVTCEVTPHHLVLTDEACLGYDTATKCNPPLRGAADVEALREALADGTIDAIATDHAPHSSIDKDVEYDQAAFGMIGLETALALVLGLVRDGVLSLAQAVDRLATAPARILALPGGKLEEGGPADVTVIDPEARWTVDPAAFVSRGRNSPFAGRSLVGRASLTIVGGTVAFEAPC